jgi:hypothetical protein
MQTAMPIKNRVCKTSVRWGRVIGRTLAIVAQKSYETGLANLPAQCSLESWQENTPIGSFQIAWFFSKAIDDLPWRQ